MDGNTSSNEEKEFCFALQNDMPDVFNGNQITFDLLAEIEKLVSDLKQALDSDKMSLLTQKAE